MYRRVPGKAILKTDFDRFGEHPRYITFCKNLFRQQKARYQTHIYYPEELAGLFCCCHFQVPIPLWRVGWIKESMNFVHFFAGNDLTYVLLLKYPPMTIVSPPMMVEPWAARSWFKSANRHHWSCSIVYVKTEKKKLLKILVFSRSFGIFQSTTLNWWRHNKTTLKQCCTVDLRIDLNL